MLSRYKIDSETFWSLLKSYSKFVEKCSLSGYLAKGYPDKRTIKYDPDSHAMIIQAYRVKGLDLDEDWRQVVLYLDDSLNGIQEVSAPFPWANQANKRVEDILLRHYTDKEINDLLRKHSLKERDMPIHYLLPEPFKDGCVHRFENCVYYDINGAHTDALIEIFPEARKELESLHHTKGGKNFINVFVGDLCNRGFRGTFDWIIQRTREKLTFIREQTGGMMLYANTDGIIVWNPSKRLKTSDKVGDIKAESADGVIYAYNCPKDDDSTSYTLYQYVSPKDGITIKGNARLAARQGIDLSKGIVRKYLLTRADGFDELIDLRTEKVDVIDEGGYYSI